MVEIGKAVRTPRPRAPIRRLDLEALQHEWEAARPFNHVVIDDFLTVDYANGVASEFPDFNHPSWMTYDNPIEFKKIMNHYDKFGPATYRLFHYLNSRIFVRKLERLVGCQLYPDIGLNGGGLHTHKNGGKLNPHLDYSLHPKLGLERRLNLILYLTPGWNLKWGGALGMWAGSSDSCLPEAPEKSVDCLFNRAVIFDTTQNSWHGLLRPITCPEGVQRNSLAVYFLCKPRPNAPSRGKALFAPYRDQADKPEILELIRKRAAVETAQSVYETKK